MKIFSVKDNPKHPLYWAYHRTRNRWPIWYYWLNGSARRFWKAHQQALSTVQQRILRDLDRDGIALAPITDFVGADVFPILRKAAGRLFAQPAVKGEVERRRTAIAGDGAASLHKEFFVYAMGGGIQDRPPLDLGNPLLQFVLDERIVGIAAAYLRLAPRFNSFALLQTLMVPAGRTRTYSQRWHRDLDDKKMLKVFIYLSDVDTGSGPFTYVKGSQLGGRWRHVAPQLPPVGRYPKDGEVESAIPERDWLLATAQAGTLIFADTSGLHRGGYCTARDRFHFVGSFISWASALPASYQLPNEIDLRQLTPLARYAISGE